MNHHWTKMLPEDATKVQPTNSGLARLLADLEEAYVDYRAWAASAPDKADEPEVLFTRREKLLEEIDATPARTLADYRAKARAAQIAAEFTTPVDMGRGSFKSIAVQLVKDILSQEPDCPAERIGREVASIVKAGYIFDGLPSDKSDRVEAAERLLSERRGALQDLVTTVKATSFAGSMFQCAFAYDEVKTIESSVGNDHAEIKFQCERISRLLYSIASVLQAAAGIDPDEVAADFYMGENQSPFQLVENALAGKLAVETDEQEAV